MPRNGWPYQLIAPALGGIRPDRTFRSVVLPQPDGPTMLTIVPASSVKERSAMTGTSRQPSS